MAASSGTHATRRSPSRSSKQRAKSTKKAAAKRNGKAKPRGKKRRTKKPPLTARNADKHVLYQLSVQDADVEVAFIEKIFKRHRKRRPLSLREDFCGTALVCAKWVETHRGRTVTGIDIDPAVLAWGKQHNVAPLSHDQKSRLTLLQQDVRDPCPGRFDAVVAFNFSYWVFKTRAELRDYFKRARKALGPDGVFYCDAYGGWESIEPMFDQRSVKGKFTYVWDQDVFDPITHQVVNYIHFEFKDGSKMKKAFTYDWRYWSLPELQELLLEAGFSEVVVYWDRSDDDDDEDYRPTLRAENQPGWLAYLAALR